ncbi:alcohol dehydrogenase catalytic domain-containing protein [Serratia marcescens]|uniref:alcohol dehydrogenase catalytic domain-containing protein n=1 Tax=Serratia marcescens TaxID=615 RepID=UPI0020C74147|nr:alcohol dehydrogenase catalytic domain-containing protein [Serratia marcescens]
MKAVVMTGANRPWEVKLVPMPRAEPGQVLVKVHASGMCYTDVWATQGYGGDIYPQTPGHEVVGEVVEVGAGVHTRQIGDRVGTTWVQSSCGRCPYCRESRPLTGQTAMNCPAPRTTGFFCPGRSRRIYRHRRRRHGVIAGWVVLHRCRTDDVRRLYHLERAA